MAAATGGGARQAAGGGAEKEKDKGSKESPLELSFSLRLGDAVPVPFCLRGQAQARVGRGAHCDLQVDSRQVSFEHCVIFLKKKNRDVQLCVKDASSKNKTGVRHARAVFEGKAPKVLLKDEVEVLHHNSELWVPPLPEPADGSKDHRVRIRVIFTLPDAWEPWRSTTEGPRGRWDYQEKLGEGGLAIVYRARDMVGKLGLVAVKVSKFINLPGASAQNRHVYALHREARWSMQRLHNPRDKRHDPRGADLFVRYLEDQTGFVKHGFDEFDKVRLRYEDPAFLWAEHCFDPPLAARPYVVLELVGGRLLQSVIDDKHAPLVAQEKRAVVRMCSEALVYMRRFGVIHRDFRGCNMFLQERAPQSRLKVIDLGFMISTEPPQQKNPNAAVRCAWQGDATKKVRFDWAPPEVRARGSPNFGAPACCFDVYSLGVLVLKLLRGRAKTQELLETQKFDQIRDFEPE
ncbi:unnamed protein product, partial [Prorocentrum cordatum]